MKKMTLSLIMALLLFSPVFAQYIPQGMKYQAVARDPSGEVMADKKVNLQVKFQSNLTSRKVHYSETHVVTTNQFGLFSLVIGNGSSNNGNFDEIPWSDENIWMEISIKDGKKSGYTIISDSKLLAVPYAFHAGTASNIAGVKSNNGVGNSSGVPSRVWSLKGNSNTNPEMDKLGTTDNEDLIFITNDLIRLKISSDGKISILGNLEVDGDLTVGGNVHLNNNEEKSPLGETLNYGKFTSKGQVKIDANIEGNQDNYNKYPLLIEGSEHGIAIKIKETDKLFRDQNFITFFDENGTALGRIEGFEGLNSVDLSTELQILACIISSSNGYPCIVSGEEIDTSIDNLTNLKNTYFNTAYSRGLLVKFAKVVAQTGAFLGNGGYALVTGATVGDADDPFVELFKLFIEVGLLAAYNIPYYNDGVSFETGGADYAEWLKKDDPNEDFSFGDVVGVKGGVISKKYTDANQFMVISRNPTIIGAMPENGTQNEFEKVALMGQVPVLTSGKVALGDYILPSKNGDGSAIAVNPESMRTIDFKNIIGVAWSSSDDSKFINYINTAVGLNTNDMVLVIDQMQLIIDNMQNALAETNPNYKPIYFDNNSNNIDNSTSKSVSSKGSVDILDSNINDYIKDWIDDNTGEIDDIVKDWINANNDKITEIIEKYALGFLENENGPFKQLQAFINEYVDDSTFEAFGGINDVLLNIKNADSLTDVDLTLLNDTFESYKLATKKFQILLSAEAE